MSNNQNLEIMSTTAKNKNQVTVTANESGEVFISNGISEKDGKEYGYYRVEFIGIDRSGAFDRAIKLSALKATSREVFDLEPLNAGDKIDGQIVVMESTTKNPFRANQEPKRMVNQDGSLGGVLLYNGLPIYRETFFTEDLSAKSVFLKHTSVSEVKKTGSKAITSKAKLS